ncbi:MAG: TMEM43 family protein [Geminicoccaceae bacterium]
MPAEPVRANPVRTLVGLAVLLLAIAALLAGEWHEGRQLDAFAAAATEAVDADPSDPDLPEDRLLRLVGRATIAGPAIDPALDVGAEALRLDRTVEMYQWEERTEGSGDRRSIHHRKVWSQEAIDSSRFAYRAPVNPGRLPLASARAYPGDAQLGALRLDQVVLDRFAATQPLPDPVRDREVAGLRLVADGSGWRTGSATDPQIGDVRIRMGVVPVGTVTVVGGVRDGRVVPWPAAGGADVLLAAAGDVPLAELAGTAAGGEALTLWVRRLGFGIFAFFGMVLLWPGLVGRVPVLSALGPAPFRGPLVASLGLVAAVLLAGHLLLRGPLVWP